MTQKTAEILQSLDQQAAKIADLFARAGCELIAPDILQPADIFLDRSGENIRQRAYVFSDLDGAELCLRPDLTVPTCRDYLNLHQGRVVRARYWYRGPAFRYQPVEQPGVSPREFEQMGVEIFGDQDAQIAEAEILALAVNALRSAGLEDFTIHIGDLGLFAALADGLDMPERWRQRMKHHFWRPQAFRTLLQRLSGAAINGADGDRLDVLEIFAKTRSDGAPEAVLDMLAARGSPVVGLRGLDEIAARLDEQLADATVPPLSLDVVTAIGDYLAIDGEPLASLAKVCDLAQGLGIDIADAEQAFRRRIELASERGVDMNKAMFSAEFGRNLEYYTGFVFQLETGDGHIAGQIAGGGRYDSLLSDIGAPRPIPAVGCAIHTERLLIAAQRGRS